MNLRTLSCIILLIPFQSALGMEKSTELRLNIILSNINNGNGSSTLKKEELYLKDFESKKSLSGINFECVTMSTKTFSDVLKQKENEKKIVSILAAFGGCVLGCLVGPAFVGMK